MKKFSLNRDIKRKISGCLFTRRGKGRNARAFPWPRHSSPPHSCARAGILAVICAKLRGCIFSPAFWDCIPRIASNFCPPSTCWQFCPRRWCDIYTYTYIYTHTYIYPLRKSTLFARGFSQAKRKERSVLSSMMDVGWREMKWKEE